VEENGYAGRTERSAFGAPPFVARRTRADYQLAMGRRPSTRYLKVTTLAPDAFVAACPSRGLVARLGEKWALLTLVALGADKVRFGALKRRLQGISAKMLAQTLRTLERDGLVVRRIVCMRPVAVDYGLSKRGRNLLPLACALKSWAEKNLHAIEDSNRAWDATQAG
jgi:DNA-binding HxlR family transcriptional regulator